MRDNGVQPDIVEFSGSMFEGIDKHTETDYHIGMFVCREIMKNNIDELRNLIAEYGGVLRTAEANSAGITRTMLAKLASDGVLERIARGQYILPDTIPDELYIWQQRMGAIIYSHETALFLHDMAERTPALHSITLPSTKKLSATFPADYKVYYIKPELHELGATEVSSKFGHLVRTYDVERTICDILRSRNRIDDQTVAAAMKNYANRNDKNMRRLGEYAEIFRVTRILRGYLEVLL
jgi:predicted transcriptional regulator of viral defense system